MIKAIFFDLDGTLLNSEKRITDNTHLALKACKEKGIKIFPATGRPPLLNYILPLRHEDFELINDGGVFYNGACVSFGQWKQYATIDESIINEVIRAVEKYPDIYVALQMKDEKHSFNFCIHENDLSTWGITANNIIPYNTYNNKETVKIYIFSHNYSIDLNSLYSELKPLIGSTSSMYLTYEGKTIEIAGKNVSKKSGIETIIDFMGINESDVAVFGDDMNDLEMLSSFSNSIAMGNACDEIKAVSKYITYDNESDGIYYALKEILGLIEA
ncbi:MAG: Cof-type HAD-IIB family hydrolase [Clostridiaceae bacterium]|nr:Cof-type HAD-IIB family hydrolase [Clostridiaceae bacterium]